MVCEQTHQLVSTPFWHTHSPKSVHVQFIRDLVLLRGSVYHQVEVAMWDKYHTIKHIIYSAYYLHTVHRHILPTLDPYAQVHPLYRHSREVHRVDPSSLVDKPLS